MNTLLLIKGRCPPKGILPGGWRKPENPDDPHMDIGRKILHRPLTGSGSKNRDPGALRWTTIPPDVY